MSTHEIVILLTACINPQGMIYTALQDPNIRKQQYMKALLYYLERTNVKIVFVENTNCDISQYFQSYIDSKRLEYLFFSGNEYNKNRGKGYGEAKIISYALQYSRFLAESTFTIKITGRLIVKNINQIINGRHHLLKDHARFDFRTNDNLWTMVFIMPTKDLKKAIEIEKEKIDDSKHYYFEHAIYNYLCNHTSMSVLPFFSSPIIEGVCGTSNRAYSELLPKNQLLDNLKLSARLYIRRRQILHTILFYSLYICICCYNRIRRL